MTDLSRRSLLKTAALLPLVAASDAWAGKITPPRSGASTAASFTLQADKPGRVVSRSLASLSYETLQVVGGKYFSARNKGLVRLFRELNPHGVLRIGGNSSDYTVWGPHRGPLPVQKTGDGDVYPSYVLQPDDLHELAGFLDATGWKLIFGVNLRIDMPAMAAELAAAVKQTAGDHLLAVQIGNEPNFYESDYAAYDAVRASYAKPVRAQDIRLGGPDTAGHTDWVIDYARQHGIESVFASRHYYRGGAPNGSIANLLAGDPGYYREIDQIMRVVDPMHLPFRVTEGNSYYGGGRDGVSNVFASALWGADFMLALAQRGVAGMHFHGGTLSVNQASVGNTVHPDVSGTLAERRNAVTAYYGPVAGDAALGFQPSPLYHGMQLAQRFAGARMLPARLDAGGANLTAYAARRHDKVMVALINKDPSHDVDVAVDGLRGYATDTLMRMTAPALDSRLGTVFGDADGRDLTVNETTGSCHVRVPHASASWVSFRHA